MGPLFIMGFPRSGTTAMARALSALGRFGGYSHEGHFLYLFAQPLSRVMQGDYNENSVFRAEGAPEAFVKGFTRLANATLSETGNPDDTAWIDKTPDLAQVKAASVIGALWPDARFIYLYRPAAEAVRSSVAVWTERVRGRELATAERWLQCQSAWRAARDSLSGRAIQVYQPDMLERPAAVAAALGPVLELSAEEVGTVARVLTNNKAVNRPRGPKAAAYDAIQLTAEQVRAIDMATEREVAHWPRLKEALAQAQAENRA